MSLQDTLNTALAAVQVAKDAYDAAAAEAATAQAAVDGSKPHLASLAAIEGYAATLHDDIRAEFNALIEKARATF